MEYATAYDVGERKRGDGINEDSVAVLSFEEGHRDGYHGRTLESGPANRSVGVFALADGAGGYDAGDEVYVDHDADDQFSGKADQLLAGDALGLDTGLPPEWARDHLQSKVTVQGNMDPLLLVSGGEEMRKAAREVLAALSGGPFVFNLGHGVVPQTPPEHVAELIALVRGEA